MRVDWIPVLMPASLFLVMSVMPIYRTFCRLSSVGKSDFDLFLSKVGGWVPRYYWRTSCGCLKQALRVARFSRRILEIAGYFLSHFAAKASGASEAVGSSTAAYQWRCKQVPVCHPCCWYWPAAGVLTPSPCALVLWGSIPSCHMKTSNSVLLCRTVLEVYT